MTTTGWIVAILSFAVALVLGFAACTLIRRRKEKNDQRKIEDAEQEALRIVNEAIKSSENKKREALLEAKEEILKNRSEYEKEVKERRAEQQKQERRLQQKEENLDHKTEMIEKKEEALAQKHAALDKEQEEIKLIKRSQTEMLERISGFTADQAKDYLIAQVESEVTHETALKIKEIEARAKDEADQRAREIVATAIQRCAADHVAEITVSVVPLPNDEMKGRIIGREGRNIRTLETLTGADLIIDDTPEAITVSCFEPVRREIARLALEKLIADGRIHPTHIEEMVEKARREVDGVIRAEGERAVLETGVRGLHPELQKLLGKLHYRTSYGQNVLQHSIEVSHIAGMMAAELGADVQAAKRAGLLHDIGKALDHEFEGTHVALGVEYARKYREKEDIIHAIQAHHGDVECRTLVACLVQAADAISAARPGARRENLENYIKRLEKLEEITGSYPGVEKSYAIQAGREVRVMVKPEQVSEDEMVILARELAKRIESELEYPGQIIKLSAYDKPASLGVSITKRGNAQVMAGQSMRYDLTVANTSNVPLESFFWHDKIPYDGARPTTLTTGTYSARLNYRILYKTNYNASYQVLASNLLTGNNYSFALNAIPMQAGEVVTDIYFDFGKVPVGFQSVVNPTLSVMVNGNAVNGYQMVNRADVGGRYQGTWQTATASWVTIIRNLTPVRLITLPKTGF